MKVFCPFCSSQKPMRKHGKAFDGKGKKKQRWQCRNCGRHTIHPLRRKP